MAELKTKDGKRQMLTSKANDEVKIKAFDCLYPGLEPQIISYQRRTRAMGRKLVEIAHNMNDALYVKDQYNKRLKRELPKMLSGPLAQDYPNMRDVLEGEYQALLWFFGLPDLRPKGDIGI